MTPQCGLLTLAAPPLTMSTTLPSSRHVTTELRRSSWVRKVHLDQEETRMCSDFEGCVPPRAWLESPVWRVEHRLHPVWVLQRRHPVPGGLCVFNLPARWMQDDPGLPNWNVFPHRLMTIKNILLWWRECRGLFLRGWFRRAGNALLHTAHKQTCKPASTHR